MKVVLTQKRPSYKPKDVPKWNSLHSLVLPQHNYKPHSSSETTNPYITQRHRWTEVHDLKTVWHQRCDCYQQVSKCLMKCIQPHFNFHITPALLFNPQTFLRSECGAYFPHWINLLSVLPTIILAMWWLHSNLFHNC